MRRSEQVVPGISVEQAVVAVENMGGALEIDAQQSQQTDAGETAMEEAQPVDAGNLEPAPAYILVPSENKAHVSSSCVVHASCSSEGASSLRWPMQGRLD